jgi:hypothetical protein
MALQLPPIINTRGQSNQSLVDSITQAITGNKNRQHQTNLLQQQQDFKVQQSEQLAQQVQQAQAEQTRLDTMFLQLNRIEKMPSGPAKRTEIAKLGRAEFEGGRDGSEFIEALNATDPDQLNLNIKGLATKAAGIAGQIKEGLAANAPAKPLTPIAQARQDLKNGLITKDDFNLITQAKKSDITSIQKNLIAAGLEPGTPEFQAELLASIRKPVGTTVNVGGQGFKVPAGFMLNPDDPSGGSVVPIPGSKGGALSGEGAKLQEIARAGSDVVTQISAKIDSGEITQETLAAAATPDVFNLFKSANVQQFEALRNDLQDMLGRLRSGGAITNDELGTFSRLLPVFGDQPETIDLKMQQLGDKFDNIGTKVGLTPIPGEDNNVIDFADLP